MGIGGASEEPAPGETGGIRGNERSQSVVIGSILMFTIIIGLLGVLQLYVVPQQNADVELNHETTVKDDFSELHSGVLNAVENKRSYSETFHLGVEYPSRFILLNPPNPQGTIRTEDVGPLDDTVEDTDGEPWHVGQEVCGLPSGKATKQLVQVGNYNEIRNTGFYSYENSVTHHSIEEGTTEEFIDSDQAFIEQQTIYLRPLVGQDIARSAVGSESITFQTNETGRITMAQNEILTLQTGLSQSQWEDVVDGSDLTVDGFGSGEVDLKAQENLVLVCTAVGAGQSPNTDVDPGADIGTGPGNETFINPIGEGALQYEGTVTTGTQFELEYFSNNDAHDIDEVRVASVTTPGNNGETIHMVKDSDEVVVTVGGSFEEPEDTWDWGVDETRIITIDKTHPDTTVNFGPNAEATLQFETSSGAILTYVVEFS